MTRQRPGACLLLRLLIVAAIAAAPLSASAKRDAAKRRAVMELMELSGAARIGDQVMTQLISRFRMSFPNVPASYWNKLNKRLDASELVRQIVPVYEKHFSKDEIQGLIAFYRSTIGKKFVAVQPQLLQESMMVGQRWGQKVTKQVLDEIKRKKLDK